MKETVELTGPGDSVSVIAGPITVRVSFGPEGIESHIEATQAGVVLKSIIAVPPGQQIHKSSE